MPPAAAVPTPEAAEMDLNVLALPGTAVFLGAFIAGGLFGVPMSTMIILLGRTVRQLVPSLLAISFMVGLAYVTRYAGMDTVMGLTMTRAGWSYPVLRDTARVAGRGADRDGRRDPTRCSEICSG